MLKISKTTLCFYIGFIFLVDQITKWWVMQWMVPGQSVSVLPSLKLYFAQNKGVAFSLFASDKPLIHWALITFIVVVCGAIAYMLMRTQQDKVMQLALAEMLGGALGNLLDRIIHGHVIDFIDFYIKTWHWYTFNIADVFITVGALRIVWHSLKTEVLRKEVS